MRIRHTLSIIFKKILLFLGSIVLLSMIIFTMSHLSPMDPLQSYYGERVEKMSAAEKDAARESLGLSDSLVIQYIRWVDHAFHGDFGISYKYKQNVLDVISLRIGNTLLLGGIGFILTFVGALLLGILCAHHENAIIDRVLCKLGTITSCIPEFWLCLVLILLFSVTLGWLPSSGAYSIGHANDPIDRIAHLVLPMAVVVFSHLWYYAYLIRNRLLEEIHAEYVLLAKSIGESERRVLFRHCVRNILPTYLSIMAISVPHILGGTYIVETVFSYPGIGTLSYESARYADYNMLMVLCMLTGIIVIFCNMLAQGINERIDPRIKEAQRIYETEAKEL